ncbi:hypothetical protein GCM10018793_65410 [Streptomyces sulfonofaciens]|uniref:Uncharacterized protein n=1 Tax=Streptomyces sulfonofaciens TaxID=68272 RepID=A0A919GPB8_9ACTN|nr:hypothetical protein GCM10018793_65410 [Streptomyces sulfonofaciens]
MGSDLRFSSSVDECSCGACRSARGAAVEHGAVRAHGRVTSVSALRWWGGRDVRVREVREVRVSLRAPPGRHTRRAGGRLVVGRGSARASCRAVEPPGQLHRARAGIRGTQFFRGP